VNSYSYEEIFQDIPGDPDNCLMILPEELMQKTGWKEGDILSYEVRDGSLILKFVEA
jgi:hypothetical protein